MRQEAKKLIETILSDNPREYFTLANIGFEKESLRVINSAISRSSHPKELGSALCNEKITTDFSESQLELITPPLKSGINSHLALDQIHYFVNSKINNEMLWPLSMPPEIASENDIPIASYGSSYLGMFKETYRKGLSIRYGRTMQAISGFHFNYSLPEKIWEPIIKSTNNDQKEIRSEIYLNMLRNIFRMNWLILYLFGSSPALTKNFLKNKNEKFKKLDEKTFYLQYATSLRMSDYGYCNLSRSNTFVSLNSINDYVRDIRSATLTIDPIFRNFKDGREHQLNPNTLQIEDEYYAVARAKSNCNQYKRTSSNLLEGGIDFIEIRSLDLDPFSRTGIDVETIHFFEVFMAYCFSKKSELINKDQSEIIKQNDLLVAKYGRKPDLILIDKQKSIPLREWAHMILQEMLPIAEKMDKNESIYVDSIRNCIEKIDDPSLTLSGLLIHKLLNEKRNHIELGNHIGKLNKEYYLETYDSNFNDPDAFEIEAANSLQKQDALEKEAKGSIKTFEDYKAEYMEY